MLSDESVAAGKLPPAPAVFVQQRLHQMPEELLNLSGCRGTQEVCDLFFIHTSYCTAITSITALDLFRLD